MLNEPVRDVKTGPAEAGPPVEGVTSVTIEAPQLCSHYVARVIRAVKIGPSPAWMVRRLEAVGLRSINNVVDVTNYVMFEIGQPLHAFDFDKLRGGRIIVRKARLGEEITSIDGHERRLAAGMLVIADAERPVALAGVMGGIDSEVSAGTVNILLESARFDPLSVRKTARALAMKSDSSYRFERGLDPTLPQRASLRAAQLILETAGGQLLSGAAVAGDPSYRLRQLTLRLARLKQLLGIEIPLPEVVDALSRLELAPIPRGDEVTVTVPSWRLDINLEVDLIEEVARVVGYEQVPVREQIEVRVTAPDPDARSMETIRSTLVAAGYFEAVTFSFVADLVAGDFVPAEAQSLARVDAVVRKADAGLRPSLLPGLLEAIRRNETAGSSGARLFETGSTFWHGAGGTIDERPRLALAGDCELRNVRGAVEEILLRLNGSRDLLVVPDHRPGYAKGACGRIEWNGQAVGYLGRIDRGVADKLGLGAAPVAAELELAPLLAGAQHVPQLKPLPRFPAVRRDLSLVLAEQIRYDAIAALIHRVNPANLEALEYVTTYRGKPLEKGQKSVTTALVFRSATSTLTGEQVEDAVQKVVAAAKSELSAMLRA
jgi:phenylalanyl-tRNA synthetase beta chain